LCPVVAKGLMYSLNNTVSFVVAYTLVLYTLTLEFFIDKKV